MNSLKRQLGFTPLETANPKMFRTRYAQARFQTGFTMIELMMGLALFSIIAFFLAYLGIYHFQTFQSESAELTVTSDARATLDDIDNYVRQSYRVASSYSTYTTGENTLALQIPSINASSQIIDGTYDYIVFYLSDNKVFKKIFPHQNSSRANATITLAANVTNFSLSYDNEDYTQAKQVTTTITISQQAGTQTKSITVSSQAKIRNY